MKLGGMHTVTFPFSLSSFQPQQKDIKRRQLYCCNYYWSNIYIPMSKPRNSLISQLGSVPHSRLWPMHDGEGTYAISTDNPIILWNRVIRYKRKRGKCWRCNINIWQLHFTLQSSSIYVHSVSWIQLQNIFVIKINYYPFLRQPESEGQAKWSHRRLSSLSPCMHSVHNYTWSNSLWKRSRSQLINS